MKTLFRKFRHPRLLFWLILVESISLWSIDSLYARAQIVPDRTLGDESSVVVPNVEIEGKKSERVEGGAIRGNNLFHSFQEFNIDAGRGAYFANPSAIENIFTRVTGANPSEIFGTLGVLGNANLFFLNPNGIIFGANASLDLRGSFVATTADSIIFPDGKEFNATNPDVAPLLTVEVQQPIGLKFEGESGIITNAANLAVASRQTLSLSGSEVEHTGKLTAPGGRVEVLGTETVALLDNATIDVSSGTGGGTVLIGGDFQGTGRVPNAKRTYVGNNVTINADALINGNGGKVIIWSDEVTGFYGQINARGGIESGDGGSVEVSSKEHLIFRGKVDTSAINGLPGTLFLDPTNIIIANGSGDEAGDGTDTFAGNNSGVVGSILTAPLSEIEDTAPTTIYESELEGLSGNTNIILQATNNITLQDLSDDGLDLAAGEGVIAFSADADGDGVGDFVMEDNFADTIFTNGRDIFISGANLTIGNIDTSLVIGGEILTQVDVDAGGPIPEPNNPEATAIFTFTVPEISEPIGSISLRFSAVHTYDEDLDVSLRSPAGTLLELFRGVGGSGDNFQDTLLADSATNPSIVAGSAPFDGQFQPSGAGGFAVFQDENSRGTWQLLVTDNFPPEDNGFLLKAGNRAPWGTAIGTQLMFRSPVTAGKSGKISLNATRGDVEINSLQTSNSINPAGDITVEATGKISLNDTINTSADLNQAGAITLRGSGDILLKPQSSILSRGLLGGNITLHSDADITFTDGLITSRSLTNESGFKGGNIQITANSLFLRDGAGLAISTAGAAEAGNLLIQTSNLVSLDGISSEGIPSRIVNQVAPTAVGNAGRIGIEASILSLDDGAQLSSGTFGMGDGGEIAITATEAITMSGANSEGFSGGIFSQVGLEAQGTAGDIIINTASLSLFDGAQLTASTFGVGDAGAIEIEMDSLSLTDGSEVSASTNGLGNAKAITITASDAISLSGESSQGLPSGIFSQVNQGARGTAGGITIDTGSLSLTDGAEVSASTFGVGNAKAITITASDAISLSGESSQGLPSGIFSQVNQGARGTAGSITIDTGSLSLTDGAEVSASTFGVGDAGALSITATDAISLSGESNQGFLSGIFSAVEPEAQGTAGGITINTASLSLTDGAEVTTKTEGEGKAGDIAITANTLEATSGSQIKTNTTTDFEAADITLEISNKIFLSGTNGGLFAQTEGAGKAGNIIINSPQLTIDRGASISAFTQASGNGGTITVNAPQEVLLTDNSELTVETSGAGKPGDITITTPNLTIGKDAEISATATETSTNTERGGSITINSSNLDLTGKLGIFAETQGVAPAGTLNIQPDNDRPNLDIQFTDTALISASTRASGRGGDINLTAPETINITGQGKVAVETTGTGNAGSINITTQNFNLSQQTEISASTFSSGRAGNINITANNFNLTEGVTVVTNTTSSGQAGDIQLQIRDNLNLVDSAIAASTAPNSQGKGGNIDIDPQVVTLNNSQIAVNSQGEGTGGSITLQAGNLNLDNQSAISAETLSTDGGNIEIALGENLILRDNSQISATAGTARAGGDGGNIEIDAQFILAFPTEDSNITANAFFGNGGNISITAEGILGLEFRENPTILSDITASSEFGLAGTVNIDTPETDPNRGLITLPQQAVDTQVALGCDVDGEGAVTFYNLGRGGLATSPHDFLIPDTVIGEWLPLTPSFESFDSEHKLGFELNSQQRTTVIRQLVPVCKR